MAAAPHGTRQCRPPIPAAQVQDDRGFTAKDTLPVKVPGGKFLDRGLCPQILSDDLPWNRDSEFPLDPALAFRL